MNIEFKDGTEIVEFNSLSEFHKYITETPINSVFHYRDLGSSDNNYNFSQAHSFEEAMELFKNGWPETSKELIKQLATHDNDIKPTMKARNIYDVAGYQCSVPRHVQGLPTSMINKKMTQSKDKVITIDKSINYSAGVGKQTIVDESVKVLHIVKKLEQQGKRVNLNIILAVHTNGKQIMVKIRIKSANEKLNVSKLAFPLVHPSMLRRLLFRFIEVHPTITKAFTKNYGYPVYDYQVKKLLPDNEFYIPGVINRDVKNIKSLDDLKYI